MNAAEPFAFYRLPGAAQAHCITPQSQGDKSFVFHDFLGQTPYEFSYEKAAAVDFQADWQLPEPRRHFKGLEAPLDEGAYRAVLRALITQQKKRRFKKVVFSRYAFQAQKINPFRAFQKLCTTYPHAMVYLWYHPDTGYWLGATPELLVAWAQGVLTTVALAGTQVHTQAPTWNQKERMEQQLVTDYISVRLRAFSKNVQLGQTHTVRAGHLCHLKTQLSARIAKDKIEAVTQRLHPTPAVCGLPLREAKAFILEHENYERRFYTGFLGLKTPDTTQLYVNLRCAEIYANGIRYFAGSGITSESQVAAECSETESKFHILKRILKQPHPYS